jgi:dTDP-4-amino-4,6-dideoxygalactose transaminase
MPDKSAPELSSEIPFNRPSAVGLELKYIQEALSEHTLAGDGFFNRRCEQWLQDNLGAARAILVPSCTAALEMSALMLDIEAGDEVIMPSFTFVSTANAFLLRGAVPVFVDIRSDTLNIDDTEIERAITPRTKAIAVVHYAGEPCAMDAIMKIAARHGLAVVEDAAQALLSRYKSRHLGTIGRFGCISFHSSKNVVCGEGGALLLNDERDIRRAEIIREKGTNRAEFFRGDVQKYTWVDIGSSYLLGELSSAYLFGQLEAAHRVNARRLEICAAYRRGLDDLERAGLIRLPRTGTSEGNGHIFCLLAENTASRDGMLSALKRAGIGGTFHYVPLHSSPAGLRYARTSGTLQETDRVSATILRLPLFATMTDGQVQTVIRAIRSYFSY